MLMPHAVSAALGKDMASSDIGIITTLHGTDVTILGHDPGLKNTVRYGLNKSTIVTAVSESLRQETIEIINPSIEIRTIYNFIDEKKYRQVNPGHSKVIFIFNRDEKVVIHISNFREVKNIPDVIKGFKKIRSKIEGKTIAGWRWTGEAKDESTYSEAKSFKLMCSF